MLQLYVFMFKPTSSWGFFALFCTLPRVYNVAGISAEDICLWAHTFLCTLI